MIELEGVRQERGNSGRRRWFADESMELIVWYSDAGVITGFQLCYDVPGTERAFTWRAGTTLTHAAIDSGEESPLFNRSPFLVSCPTVDVNAVVTDFQSRSADLPPDITEVVIAKLSSGQLAEEV